MDRWPIVGVLFALPLLAAACAERGPDSKAHPAATESSSLTSTNAARSPWQQSLRARRELSTPGKPEHVRIADVDGDGKPELLALTREPGALLCWRDLLSPPRVLELPDFPLGLELISRSGKTLIALASRAGRELLLLDLSSPDPLAEAQRHLLPAPARLLATGDLGADGWQEIVVATRAGELYVLGQNGTHTVPLLDRLPSTLLVLPEGVLVGSQVQMGLRAYAWQPEQGLEAAAAGIALGGIPRALAAAPSAHAVPAEVWVAGGERQLWRLRSAFDNPQVELSTLEPGAIPVDLEFLATPDRPTLLTLAFRDLRYVLWRNGSILHQEYAGQDAWDASGGDLDQDGNIDLAFALRDARRVAYVRCADDGSFEESLRLPVEAGPHSLAVGDLDGVGPAEILTLCAKLDGLCVLRKNAEVWELAERLNARPAASCLRALDVDRDGATDVLYIVRGESGSRMELRFGAPAQRLADAPLFVQDLGGAVSDCLLADLNDNGQGELWFADPQRGLLLAYELVPGRKLTAVARLELPGAPRALCLCERPGRDLLAIACGEPGARTGIALVEWKAAAAQAQLVRTDLLANSFGTPIDLELLRTPEATTQIALLCKASAGDGAGRIELFHEAPDGWQRLEQSLPTGARPYAIATGDGDGDGYDELFASAQNSHHVNFWRGSANGPQAEPDLGVGLGVLDILYVDLDGDGRPELLSANAFSNDLSLVQGSH